jgi:PAS domain S-box-containing protein
MREGKPVSLPGLPRLLLALAISLLPVLCLAATPLKVGLYQNPPKVFRDARGEPAGLFVDILAAIARQERWQLDYVACEWDACLQMLQQGELDLMPDVAFSQERARRFDFPHQAVLSNWALLYASDSHDYNSILDLEGKRIAVIAQSSQYAKLQRRAAEFSVKPGFVELSGSEQTMRAVAEGRADAALVNRLYGLRHAKAFGLEATHILLDASQLYFATPRGRHPELLSAIDRDLQAMKAEKNSPYYRALKRWIEPLERPGLPAWLGWGAGGVGTVLLLLAFHILVLRRTVRRSLAQVAQHHAALAESEAKFRTLFETAADAMLLTQGEELLEANPAMLRMFGYADIHALQAASRDGLSPPLQPDGESSRSAAEHHIQQALDAGHAFFEWVHRRADGAQFPAEVTLVPMQVQGQAVLQSTIRDISQRKQDEARLQQLNRALQTLSKVNHTLVYAEDEADLLGRICRTIVEAGGYRLAWVGFAQHDEARSVAPAAQYGLEEGYLDGLRISWKDDQYGRGPTGTAIRHGKPYIVHAIDEDPHCAPWQEQARQHGFASSIALPLQRDGVTFGALNIYSGEPNTFGQEELELLMELADDLAFGIHTQRLRQEHLQLEEERREHRERLQNSLLQTIQSITIMLEKRDPYTAGHQRRAADLAVAIARELQLDENAIEGIRLGTMIHDIGIIYVPAEIINRPGKLSQSERNIVHSHAEVGYDITKDIDFPWPVAQMVLQHHERLDGSGYPAGLKGDEILFEARIIGVVDMIEAMLSHRPYRPALGIEAVIQELQQNRGIKYDERVVDASLRLFLEKGYSLPA